MQPLNDRRGRHAAEPSTGAVRAQLQRILDSRLFLRSERLSAFLQFVVESTLNGEAVR